MAGKPNPAHLWLGTAEDNAHDRDRKGRAVRNNLPVQRGTEVFLAKLTDDAVRSIRCQAKAGETLVCIARRFGVHDSQISRIVRGLAWKHVE